MLATPKALKRHTALRITRSVLDFSQTASIPPYTREGFLKVLVLKFIVTLIRFVPLKDKSLQPSLTFGNGGVLCFL